MRASSSRSSWVCGGLALIRGMRRALTDAEQDRVADATVRHLESSNWKIEERQLGEGHGGYLMGE